jgi:hypothetical protein
MKRSQLLAPVALLALAPLILAAGLAWGQDAPAPEVAGLRLANLSPDAPQLDLLLDGQLVLQDLAFPDVSGYLLIPAGRHELRIFPHRAPAEETPADTGGVTVRPLEPMSITVDVVAGRYYTLTASGFFDPPGAATRSGHLVVQMDEGTTAQVRGPRNYLVSLSEESTLSGLPPGAYTVLASRPGFRSAQYEVDVQPGSTVTLPITLQAGTDTGVEQPAAPAIGVTERPWYKTQLQLYEDELSAVPPAGQALIRLVHAAPAVPAIRARVLREGDEDEAPLAEHPLTDGLTFPNASDAVLISVEHDVLEVSLSGSNLIVARLEPLRFASGAIYTVFVTGSNASNTVTLLPSVDSSIRSPLP